MPRRPLLAALALTGALSFAITTVDAATITVTGSLDRNTIQVNQSAILTVYATIDDRTGLDPATDGITFFTVDVVGTDHPELFGFDENKLDFGLDGLDADLFFPGTADVVSGYGLQNVNALYAGYGWGLDESSPTVTLFSVPILGVAEGTGTIALSPGNLAYDTAFLLWSDFAPSEYPGSLTLTVTAPPAAVPLPAALPAGTALIGLLAGGRRWLKKGTRRA